MFAEAIENILQAHCTPAQVRAIELGGSWQPLANAFEDSGFTALLVPESQDGAGASWRDLYAIVELAGAWSLPLPFAQTLAARSLVRSPGLLPAGMLTFAPSLQLTVSGSVRAANVPFLRTAGHVLGILNGEWVCADVAAARVQPLGVHGGLAASAEWMAEDIRGVDACVSSARFQSIAALLVAGLLAGAMKRAFDLSMDYANQRVQFGRSIGKFQAIQHQLAVMAEQVAAGRMAAQAAFGTDDGGVPAEGACAVAKARTSEAAAQVAAIAHAVHGAMGITEEYDLQLSTRRLHEWRMAHGSEIWWHRVLGRQLLASPLPTVTDFTRSLLA